MSKWDRFIFRMGKSAGVSYGAGHALGNQTWFGGGRTRLSLFCSVLSSFTQIFGGTRSQGCGMLAVATLRECFSLVLREESKF